MKLEIEYPMLVEALPPRNKTRKAVLLKDVYVAEIPEYSPDEARLVLTQVTPATEKKKEYRRNYVDIAGGLFTAGRTPEISDGRVRYEFGYEKSQLISPIFHNVAHAAVQTAIGELAREWKSEWHRHIHNQDVYDAYTERWGRAYRAAPTAFKKTKIPSISELKLLDIDEGAVAAARATVAKSIDDVILVGGRFFVRRPEPILMAKGGNDVDQPTVSALSGTSYDDIMGADDVDLSTAFFAADDLESAKAYASEMWRLRNGSDEDYDVLFSGDTLEIANPSLLKFDGDRISALRAAEVVKRSFGESMVPLAVVNGRHAKSSAARSLDEISLEGLTNYKNLQSAYESAKAGGDAALLGHAIRDCLAGRDSERFTRDSDPLLLGLAITRWEHREARRDFGLTF